MKKLLQSLVLLMSTQAFATTTITTATASGTWTLAGSPYIVQVPVTVPLGSTLRIEPGVTIKFMPAAKIDVLGMFVARGTATAPIMMMATDTAGWANDLTTTGGWGGIHLRMYTGADADSSTLQYCTIKDCKYGFSTALNYYNPLDIERKAAISHCNIYHNTTGMGGVASGDVIMCITYSTADTISVTDCDIHDNVSITTILYDQNSNGYGIFRNNHIHHNSTAGPMTCNPFKGVLENSEIDNNDVLNSNAPLTIGGTGSVTNNKIHHNRFDRDGAIHCLFGTLDLDNNLISNNYEVDALVCHGLYCSSGILLECSPIAPLTHYRLRNNIIANNTTQSGGSAISIVGAYAEILNNTIVNNNASGFHRTISIMDNGSLIAEAHLKNNIISAPTWTASVGTLGADNLILIHSATSKVEIDYNYLSAPFHRAVFANTTYVMLGDTTHNITGASPMMVAPTTDDVYTTDATTASFALMATSPCIDYGTSVGASPLSTDYAGLARITGSAIDIGAHEYFKEVTTGIAGTGKDAAHSLALYPNPTHDGVTIATPEATGRITLMDMSGRIMLTAAIDKKATTLSLTGIPGGVYVVQYDAQGVHQTSKLRIQ